MMSDEKLEQLRERADLVLTELSKAGDARLDRPVFVEFSGTPKSGKSTCIEIIAHFFGRSGYKVLSPAEGASRRTPYYLKENWMAFNTWSASYALMHVLEGLHGSDQYHLAILDRGLFDALAWFEFLAATERTSEDVRNRVQGFLLIDDWRDKIDAVLLFKTDADTSLNREKRDKLTSQTGSAMNPKVLKNLNSAYDAVHQKYADAFSTVKIVKTSDSKETEPPSDSKGTEPQSTAFDVANIILDVFEAKLAANEGRQP